MGKMFATRHNYNINLNQERIAVGAANIFGSFFFCIPTTGAVARSAVQESVGGSTQVFTKRRRTSFLHSLRSFVARQFHLGPGCSLRSLGGRHASGTTSSGVSGIHYHGRADQYDEASAGSEKFVARFAY